MVVNLKTPDAHFASALAPNRAGRGPRHTKRKNHSSVSCLCRPQAGGRLQSKEGVGSPGVLGGV